MTEIFIVLSLLAALVWVIARAILMLLRRDAQDEIQPSHVDPISTYVDENYGSHFVDDPISINHSLHRR